MTPSEQNTERLHVKVPLSMKKDLEAKARKLGVSEARIVRDALKAQGFGVRWTEPPPAAISPERPLRFGESEPKTLEELIGHLDPLAHAGQKFTDAERLEAARRGVSLERPEEYVTTQRKFGAHKGAGFAERQRVLRAQMQPEA